MKTHMSLSLSLLLLCIISALCYLALLSYRLLPCSHGAQKAVHFFFHFCALTLSIIAVRMIVVFHDQNNIPNYYSAHACMGLAAIALYATQFVIGLASFYAPASMVARAMRAKIMPW